MSAAAIVTGDLQNRVSLSSACSSSPVAKIQRCYSGQICQIDYMSTSQKSPNDHSDLQDASDEALSQDTVTSMIEHTLKHNHPNHTLHLIDQLCSNSSRLSVEGSNHLSLKWRSKRRQRDWNSDMIDDSAKIQKQSHDHCSNSDNSECYMKENHPRGLETIPYNTYSPDAATLEHSATPEEVANKPVSVKNKAQSSLIYILARMILSQNEKIKGLQERNLSLEVEKNEMHEKLITIQKQLDEAKHLNTTLQYIVSSSNRSASGTHATYYGDCHINTDIF